MINTEQKYIAVWGYPDLAVVEEIKQQYPHCELLDLDVSNNYPDTSIIPDAYCQIIKNIVNNAVYLKNSIEVIIASVGEEKCDSGRFAALILKNLGFNIIETRYNAVSNGRNIQTPLSKSDLPLKTKIITIMDNLIFPQPDLTYSEVKPEFGFWGVPPNDTSILELFPNTTHVYGWTRAVEAGFPADLDLEMFVDENVPTVFFAQSFCAKMQLAKYLADKHGGLYIDVDDLASNSVKAKIEAFIRLG